MKKAKSLNCVEIKRQSATQIYEQVKNLSAEEELVYWRERSEALYQKQQTLQNK